MPYKQVDDLPESVRDKLPKHAQEIYLAAYNNAWQQYKDPKKRRGDEDRETVSHKIAWSAVKEKYEKREDRWVKKDN